MNKLMASYLLSLLMLFVGCGTEVGNGICPFGCKDENKATPPEEEVQNSDEPTVNAAAAVQFFAAPCASPLAEVIEQGGEYLDSEGDAVFELSQSEAQTTLESPEVTYVVQQDATTAAEFDIKYVSGTELESATCGEVTSTSTDLDGYTEVLLREVTVTIEGSMRTVRWWYGIEESTGNKVVAKVSLEAEGASEVEYRLELGE